MSANTKLGSAEYREREAASKVLLDDTNLTLSDIESQLKNPSVKHSAEVKTRLLSIAKDRFLKSDRAALGFMFGGNLVDRVVVGQTYPKFPVHGVLHVGDIIVEADGVDLCSPRGRSTMQAMIVSRDPGQTLPLTIRRGKEKLKLDIKLGKFSDLEQFGRLPAGVPAGAPAGAKQGVYGPPADVMMRAWEVRERSMNPPVQVIRCPNVWKPPTSEQVAKRREQVNQRFAGMVQRPAVAPGGRVRGEVRAGQGNRNEINDQLVQRMLQQAQPGMRVVWQGGMQGGGRWSNFADPDDQALTTKRTAAEELAELARAKNQAESDRNNLLRQQGLTPESRETMLEEIGSRLNVIELQRDAIEAELLEQGKELPAVPSTGVQTPEIDELP